MPNILPEKDANGIYQVNNSMIIPQFIHYAAFFMFAESGAMGEPGCITWFLGDGSQYHGNYCFGDVELTKLEKAFPVFAECSFGILGPASQVPEGWKYVYLGMGNHLIVSEDYYGEFEAATKDYENPAEYYQNWQRIAKEILKK